MGFECPDSVAHPTMLGVLSCRAPAFRFVVRLAPNRIKRTRSICVIPRLSGSSRYRATDQDTRGSSCANRAERTLPLEGRGSSAALGPPELAASVVEESVAELARPASTGPPSTGRSRGGHINHPQELGAASLPCQHFIRFHRCSGAQRAMDEQRPPDVRIHLLDAAGEKRGTRSVLGDQTESSN